MHNYITYIPTGSPCDWFDWGTSFAPSFCKSKTFPSNPLREEDNSSHVTLVSHRVQALYSKATSEIFFRGRRGCRWCCHGNHSMALSLGSMYVALSVPEKVLEYRQQMTEACFIGFVFFFPVESKIHRISVLLLIVWLRWNGLPFNWECGPSSRPVFPGSGLGPPQPWPFT